MKQKLRQWWHTWRVFRKVPWTSRHIGFIKSHVCVDCEYRGWKVVKKLGRK